MKATVIIANIFDQILEETEKDLIVIKDGKIFRGALFFELDKEYEEIAEILDKVEVEGSALDIIMEAYKLKKKHNLLKGDNMTLKTMLHWQFINGLTDEMFTYGYGYKNDNELLAHIN